MSQRTITQCPSMRLPNALILLRQIYRWWRLHPHHRLSKARGHRSRQGTLPWRWVETVTSPAIISDPLRAGSGNGAASGHRPKSDKVELRIVLCLLLAGLCIGCDSSSSTGPDGSPFAGTYVGTTEQGKAIQFTVASDGGDLYISAFQFGLSIHEPINPPGGGGCISFSAETEVNVRLQRLVINPASFRVELPKDVPVLTALPMEILWDGSLGTQAASGTLFGEQAPGSGFGSCGGRGLATWTATRM